MTADGDIVMLMRRAEQPAQPVTWPGWEQSIQYAVMNLGDTQLTFFAVRFGQLRDRFGTSWMVTALKPARAGLVPASAGARCGPQ